MIRHNLILTLRNFSRFKSSFFINLFGLSTGLACTLFIFLWVTDEMSVDKFHLNGNNIYNVMEHQQYADYIMTTTSTPGLLAAALKEDYPEVLFAATTTWVRNFTLSIPDKDLKAKGFYVGADFFNIFTYPLIDGDAKQVLLDKNSIVISEDLALRLFNTTEGLIGKSLSFQHRDNFLISGVFENTPSNSSYNFDFVLSFEKYKDENNWVKNWGSNGPSTFVVMQEGVEADLFSDKISDYVLKKNEGSHISLFLYPFSERYLRGRFENGVQAGGRIDYVHLFSVIAIFILLIACINFMNLATARASRRAKEVGIKKAVGAPRASLVFQYLTESVLLSLCSFLLAMLFVFFFLPQFNDVTAKEIPQWFGFQITLTFLGISIFTGLIAGSYPAFYLSGFTIVKVLKGEIKGSLAELWARKGLVIFQFTLSVILIVSVLVIYKQIDFVQTKNLGYEKENIIYFSQEGKLNHKVGTYLNQANEIPGVKLASSIGHKLMGTSNNTSGLDWPGKDPIANILFENVRVNYDMLELLGLELKEGRTFSRDFGSDSTNIIFNEAAIKVMGLENPIGKTITLWGEYKMQIVGVVKDFHFQSLHEQVKPLFFLLSQESTDFVMARLEAGREKEALMGLQEHYQSFNPGFTLEYKFMDDTYQSLYKAEQRVSVLSRYFAGMAIIISCLGLFGLASFTAERRKKEIGIRKALGSNVLQIMFLLSSDFTKLVVLSILIALPVSYYLIDEWLTQFAFRISLHLWFFIGAGASALLIAWLTVGSQAFRAAKVNPVDCLRSE